MKKKISISIDEETLLKILAHIEKGRFRNKSHAIEYAVNNLLEEDE
ncbi:ribbon-helix-helix domain-containing protein [Candidatus Woesearchaeota archaeon]|nr:ribbon-helix-helix domain-containing protein [Candidatus Woesearchaeota archaeon]